MFTGDFLPQRDELSSCWDRRPLRHNKHGPKSGGGWQCYAPFRGAAGSLSSI